MAGVTLLTLSLMSIAIYGQGQTQLHPLWGLHAVGNKLYNGANIPIQLRGVDRSGTEYMCAKGYGFQDGPYDYNSIASMAAWDINVVRIPLNEACWLNVNTQYPQYAGQAYQAFIYNYVKLILSQDIGVILDLHWTAGGDSPALSQQPMPDKQYSVTFWNQVAVMFKNVDGVIFDLFNEPYPDNNGRGNDIAAWNCWKNGEDCNGINYNVAGMQLLLTEVRNTGATNLVMLGGIAYSSDLTLFLQYMPNDPANNLAASIHIYDFGSCNDLSCWETNFLPVSQRIPIIAGEFGSTSTTDNGAFVTNLLAWFEAHGIHYLAWAWTPGSVPAVITDYNGVCTIPFGCTVQQIFLQSRRITTTTSPAPNTTSVHVCISSLDCDPYHVCISGTCVVTNYGNLTDTTSQIQIVIPAIACTSSMGTVIAQAATSLPGGANFCNSSYFSDLAWCYNDPTLVGASSLSFLVPAQIVPANTSFNSTLFVSLLYAGGNQYSALTVSLDGLFSFGGVLTPLTSSANAVGTAIGEVGTTLTTGLHVITISMLRGSLYLDSIVLTNYRPTAVSDNIELPLGAVTIYAQDYTSAYSPPGFVPNINADGSFRGSRVVNFCKPIAPGNTNYFCLNAPPPTGNKVSYLLLTYTCISAGYYYAGVTYRTADPKAQLILSLDNLLVEYFGPIPTPVTLDFVTVFAPTSGYLSVGAHSVGIQIFAGNIDVNSITIQPAPLPAVLVKSNAVTCRSTSDCFTGGTCKNGVCAFGGLRDPNLPVQVEIPSQNCSSCVGTPSLSAMMTTSGGANFCSNSATEPFLVFCLNDPSLGTLASITFTVPASLIPDDNSFTSNLYVGLVYGSATVYSAVNIFLDGAQTFGALLTPPLQAGTAFSTSIAELPAQISTGDHTVAVEVIRGSLLVSAIILSDQPIISTIDGIWPVGTFTFNAQDYTSVFTPPGFVPVAQANPKARHPNLVNFCLNPSTPNVNYWCSNNPVTVNGTTTAAYLQFTYNCPEGGWYYIGASYRTTDPTAQLNIAIYVYDDNMFGSLPTPPTSGSDFATVFTPEAGYISSGTFSLFLLVARGAIDVKSIIVKPSTTTPGYIYTQPAPTTPPNFLCLSDADCGTDGICAGGICQIGMYDDELASPYTWATAVIPTENCTVCTGVPSSKADYTVGTGANFCRYAGSSVSSWCQNDPILGSESSLSFDVPLALTPFNTTMQNRTMYFGFKYSGASVYAAVLVTLDGVSSFGDILTPPVATDALFATAVAEQPVALTEGNHTITLTILRGSISIPTIIISEKTIIGYNPGAENFAPGTVIIPAVNYVTAFSPPPFVPDPAAIPSFPGADVTNFCINGKESGNVYWCKNAPVNGDFSSLGLTYNCLLTGEYYFGIMYSTSDPTARLSVLVDNKVSFQDLRLPVTPGFTYEFSPDATIISGGKHSITLSVTAGEIDIISVIVTPLPGTKCSINSDCTGRTLCVSSVCVASTMVASFDQYITTPYGIAVVCACTGVLIFLFVAAPVYSVMSNAAAEAKIAGKGRKGKGKTVPPSVATDKKILASAHAIDDGVIGRPPSTKRFRRMVEGEVAVRWET